ncbi:hypothetical protein Tco_0950102 [Tanacetum coccineum]
MVKSDVETETVGDGVDEIDKQAELIDEHEVDQRWKGLKRQKEAKTVKNRQETGKRQRDKRKSEESAKDQAGSARHNKK